MIGEVSARRVLLVILLVAGVLVVLSIAVNVLRLAFAMDYVKGIVPMFDVYAEANVPTWFSSVLLLIAAGLAFAIARTVAQAAARDRRKWQVLSAVLLFLSIDESAKVHEAVGALLAAFTGKIGFMSSVWVYPFLVLVLVLALYFLKFVLRLPAATRNLMVLAGALYCLGALGLEFVEGWYFHTYQPGGEFERTAAFTAMATVEEALEMAGIAVLIFTLLGYLRTLNRAVEIRLSR